jgi:acetolactate synthase-1/2/3 large subunit
MIRLADFVMEWLKSNGVDTVFTVSGGGSIILCDALDKVEGINYVCCHHEQAVSMAAEGFARASGRIGVGLVTTGPGGTNAITGATCAWIDSVPQLIISGQVYLNQTIGNTGLRQQGVQEINIIELVKPISKYAELVTEATDIKFHLEKAYHLATSGRPGPSWLDIPADIQNAQIDPNMLRSYNLVDEIKSPLITDSEIETIVQKLVESQRPLIHAGHGVRIAGGQHNLTKLVEQHNICLATTWNATDIVSSSHPNFIGRPGAFAERGANFAIQNADFYLAIGSRLPYMVTGYNAKDFARNSFRIMVDIDPTEVGKESLDIHMRLIGDAGDFIKKLAKAIPKDWKAGSEWIEYCQKLRKKYPIVLSEYRNQDKWVNSYYFIEKLSEVLDNETVIVTDMGLSFVGTHQAFQIKIGQKLFTNSGHAPMGWGLPASIGAAMATPDKKLICLSGEGGLMMNIQEMATVMHNNLPIKLFIYNNGGYLTIKQTQQLGFEGRLMGSTPESGISFPDFERIAKAHGFEYLRVEDNRELSQTLENFIEMPGIGICELMLDPEQSQIPKAINKRLPDGTTKPSVFEDLYPFLGEEELQQGLIKD